jgi:hypothetical protein
MDGICVIEFCSRCSSSDYREEMERWFNSVMKLPVASQLSSLPKRRKPKTTKMLLLPILIHSFKNLIDLATVYLTKKTCDPLLYGV